MRYTSEAAALLPANDTHTTARAYIELICDGATVTRRDVQKVYAAYRMAWEWEVYKAAVLAGDPIRAAGLCSEEGVLFGSRMGRDPSDADLRDWIEFLDAVHLGDDWWSVVDYTSNENDEDCE